MESDICVVGCSDSSNRRGAGTDGGTDTGAVSRAGVLAMVWKGRGEM